MILPTRDRRELLRQSLAALACQDHDDYEVIVVDDASTDGTSELVRREFAHLRLMRFEHSIGSTAARNRALPFASGELIVFTDDDCLAAPDWLRRHVAHYRDPRVGAAGGPLKTRSPSFCDKFYEAHYREEYEVCQRLERLDHWERLVAGDMSIRRTVLDQVGLPDERFRHGADADMARRVSRAGYVVVLDPALALTHLKTYTPRSFLRERFNKACGSVMADLKDGTLRARRFVPVVNPLVAWRAWQNYRAMFGATALDSAAFWAMEVVARGVDVAGRSYYYWTDGRAFRHQMAADRERAPG